MTYAELLDDKVIKVTIQCRIPDTAKNRIVLSKDIVQDLVAQERTQPAYPARWFHQNTTPNPISNSL
jgi:hypothetical protein